MFWGGEGGERGELGGEEGRGEVGRIGGNLTARHKILVCIPQIWISEIEYYQKMSSHAQIRPQGAEIESIV